VIKYAILPLKISTGWKMFWAFLMLLFSQKTGFVFFFSSFFPFLNSEPAMIILGFLFAFVLFMFICTLFLCLLGMCGVYLPIYTVFVSAALLSVLGVFFAVKVPSVNQIKIAAGLDKPFKIVQLSDLHIGSGFTGKWLQQVVDKTNSLDPDVVVITGDLIDGDPELLHKELLPLMQLKKPVYYVFGNHEYYYGIERWRQEFEKLGLILLENSSIDLGPVIVGGTVIPKAQAFGQKEIDLEKTFEKSDVSKPRILLSHYPDVFDKAIQHNVLLQLSGHTHAGQLFWPMNLLTKRANNGYLKGMYEKNGRFLYVSHGTGIWGGLALRLGTRSEITEIILE
jgi:predicted MPP superfamily phosphohydrolase